MREIKFRAWDKVQKKFEYFILAQHAPLTTVKIPAEGSWRNLEEWEQYTGLHDKNGVEIYEGDVATWYVNDVQRTGEIYYTGQAFDMRNDATGYGYIGWDALRGEIEIIGNIYENPELLDNH